MKKVLHLLLLLLLCSAHSLRAEESSRAVDIYFDLNSGDVDLSYRDNSSVFEDLIKFIESVQQDSSLEIKSVAINSYTSPDGGSSYNYKLATKRSESIYNYLMSQVNVDRSIVTCRSNGVDWKSLKQMISSSAMEYGDEVIHIINTIPEESWARINPDDIHLALTDSRNKHLMDLRGGVPYRYILKNFYPQLRRGSIVTVSFRSVAPSVVDSTPAVSAETSTGEEGVETTPTSLLASTSSASALDSDSKTPMLAIKTNLLYDALTALNIELEVPIKDRWSIAAEWVFPWWTTCNNQREDSKRNTFQLLNGNIEGKYWFGDRSQREVMTGWHVGLYAGGGLYDLERNYKGYQGEFFIAAGVSGGYAHTISRTGALRMEYSAAVGYLKTNYDYYEEHYGINNEWHTLRQSRGVYQWFGPTRVRVSLVWLLSRKTSNKE